MSPHCDMSNEAAPITSSPALVDNDDDSDCSMSFSDPSNENESITSSQALADIPTNLRDSIIYPPALIDDPTTLPNWTQFSRDVQSINRKQYGAYKRIEGKYTYNNPSFILNIEHVQADPHSPPSRLKVSMPWSETGIPEDCLESNTTKIAVCDYVTRVAAEFIRAKRLDRNIGISNGGFAGSRGGSFNINCPGQQVLPRTSAMIKRGPMIELRFTVTLPATGRIILAREAWQILGVNLVAVIYRSLIYNDQNQIALLYHVLSVARQQSLRKQLSDLGLVCFVGNGSILPRAPGPAGSPMDVAQAVPFQSPKELEVTLVTRDGRSVTGMGIPVGVTMLTGGGFHGKSTLLKAIELGIYNHIPGDGRELVVTDPTAVKIRAEDGRSVTGVDISPFISIVPGGKYTRNFSTEDASGSTSMASNIQEALEVGCKALLIDEDSSATNLLVRDERMQQLVSQDPIQPLISNVKALFHDHHVSTILVVSGLGDWLAVADTVIAMDSYVPCHVTPKAKEILARAPLSIFQAPSYQYLGNRAFRVDFSGFRSPLAVSKRYINIRPLNINQGRNLREAEPGLDLSGLDQIVEFGQTRLIATLLKRLHAVCFGSFNDPRDQMIPLLDLLDHVEDTIGLDKPLPLGLEDGELVAIRRLEFVGALRRLRYGVLQVAEMNGVSQQLAIR